MDQGGIADAIFTDLSNAFACIKHDLSVAKLHGYGVIQKNNLDITFVKIIFLNKYFPPWLGHKETFLFRSAKTALKRHCFDLFITNDEEMLQQQILFDRTKKDLYI